MYHPSQPVDPREDEMETFYDPGFYTVKLNESQRPSLYQADGTTPLDDHPAFRSVGKASFVFQVLEATADDACEPLFFSDPPILWGDLQHPIGNRHRMEQKTLLTLDVDPPDSMPVTTTYHFTLQLNHGGIDDVLWSHDGTVVVDPTIVEKPPEG
jgi:hypothetical protein